MKNKIVAAFTLFILIFSSFSIIPREKVNASIVKDIKLVQDIGIAPEDFVGANTLSEANFYEEDYDSTYLFPLQGMCINDEDKLVILDTSYGRVHVLNQALVNIFTFGSPSELIYPVDIDYYYQNYYIADALGGVVKIYAKTGTLVKNIKNGLMTAPVGVAVIGSSIFVSDYFSNAVYKLDSNGTVLKTYNIASPGGLSTNHKDTVIAISMKDRRCYLFDANLNLSSSFSISSTLFPSDTAIDSSFNIYIADRGLSRGKDAAGSIAVYNKSGTFVKNIGTATNVYPNQQDGAFLTPSGIAIDSSNKVYVVDSGYYYWSSTSEAPFGFPLGLRISSFNFQGYFLSKKDFLHKSTGGVLINPVSATLDENGNIWVLNFGGFDSSSLVQYSQSGNFIKEIEKAGSNPIGRAYCVFGDKAGSIYVGLNGGIAQFSSSGTFRKVISNSAFGIIRKIIKGNDGFFYAVSSNNDLVIRLDSNLKMDTSFPVAKYPSGIAQDFSGNFYVTSLSDNKVHVYNSLFKEINTIGKGGGRGKEQFYIPEDVGIDSQGNVIVIDAENGRISAWSKEGLLIYLSPRRFYGLASIQIEGNYFLVTDCFHNIVRVLSEEFENVGYAFYVNFQPQDISLSPSDSETLVLNVKNLGTQNDAYLVTFDTTLPSYNFTVNENPPYNFPLESNQLKQIIVKITIPATAENGKTYEVNAKIKSQSSGLVQSANVIIKVSTSLVPVIFSEYTVTQEGQTFSVPIYIRSAKDIRGVSFDLIYDTKKINLTSVDAVQADGKTLTVFKNTSSGASVAVAFVDGKLLNGMETIATLKFTASAISTNYVNFDLGSTINVVDEIAAIESKPFVITVGPKLSVNIKDNTTSSKQEYSFTGIASPSSKVFVNGKEISVSLAGSFSATVVLSSQVNIIKVVAKAPSGEETVIERTVLYNGPITVTLILTIGSPVMNVNDKEQEIDPGRGTSPIIIPGWNRTLVPIRAVVESIGGTVDWEQSERLVTIVLNSKTIKLWIDNPIAEVDGKKTPIDKDNPYVKPIIVNSRTFIPVRFVAESLGCTVSWNDKTKQVTIVYSKES